MRHRLYVLVGAVLARACAVRARHRDARPAGTPPGPATRALLLTGLLLAALAGTPATSGQPRQTAPPDTVRSDPPPTQSVPLHARAPEARRALRAGDAAAARAALAQVDPCGWAAPGLAVRAALLAGDTAAACAVDVARAGAAGLYHRARCARWQDAGRPSQAARQQAIEALAALAMEAPVLLFRDEETVAMVLAAAGWAGPRERSDILAAALTWPVPAGDEQARRRLARVLRAIVDRPPTPALADQARERLVFELPEHALPGDVARLGEAATGPAGRLRRAAALEGIHRNADIIALVGDLVPAECEAALLVGRAWRWRQRYAEAQTALAAASPSRCDADQLRRAQYLQVRLAALQKSPAIEPLAGGFAARWGTDPLVDDVLFWLAEYRAGQHDRAGARAVLARIATEHPSGDMAGEARFRLAMELAAEGDSPQARRWLDEGLALLRAAQPPPVLQLDQARYWTARLRAMPDPQSWHAAADSGEVAAGAAALAALAAERPASYYGHLARLAVRHLQGIDPRPAVARVASLPAGATVPVPASLAALPAWEQARLAAEAGFDDEVPLLLGQVPVERGDLETASAIAALYASIDRPDLAHRALRVSGLALLPGAPADAASLQRWALAWPLAFETALSAAAAAAGVPAPLLWAVAREESAFDPAAQSSAGAIGLCQLMPRTAGEEAAGLRLPAPGPGELADPALNARLGASHLRRRLRKMGHPLAAIAAYNAGPGAVARWLPPPGQTLPVDLWVERIGFAETRQYVRSVTGSWVTYALLYGGDEVEFALEIGGS